MRASPAIAGSRTWTTTIFSFLLFYISAFVCTAPAQDPVLDDPDAPVYWNLSADLPPASELLEDVRAALPRQALRIRAQLESKSRSGTVEQDLGAEIVLEMGRPSPRAEYTILDAFGTTLARMRVEHHHAVASSYSYFTGDPLEPADTPGLMKPIQGTDVTWVDLSLAFLWWPGGKTVGIEKIKGRYTYQVDLPAPPGGSDKVAGVRLWIDPKARILLQATAVSDTGETLRRLQVKSLKKIKDIWFVKDLEVRSYPSRHKTLLRVKSVSPVDAEGG